MTADTIGRLIRRVDAGSASTSNAFADLRALTSGAFQLWLTSDLNHLAAEAPYRTLASVHGFADVSRQGPTGSVTSLTPYDFDWLSPYATPFAGGAVPACACLGTHAIHRDATRPAVWPRAVLRGRVEPPATGADKLGYILVASPGRDGTPYVATFSSGTIAGGGSWTDLEVTLQLTDAMVAPLIETPAYGDGGSSGVSPIGETVAVNATTFWCAFFSTAGKCQAVALTLSLEPAP